MLIIQSWALVSGKVLIFFYKVCTASQGNAEQESFSFWKFCFLFP